eukprot:Lithocolla_globosa_v1_NODE_4073_length_1516_cov_23.369610.p1 type:complete len:335 gc:universal NODE_4073_length_1516_cov_23.369610:396-1400(+)
MTAMAMCGKWQKTNAERTAHEKECAECKKRVKKHEENPKEPSEIESEAITTPKKTKAPKVDIEFPPWTKELIQQLTSSFETQIKPLQQQLSKFEKSFKFLSEKYETMSKEIKTLEEKNCQLQKISDQLEKRVSELEEKTVSSEQVKQNTDNLSKMQMKVAQLQSTTSTNPLVDSMIINGLPKLAKENESPQILQKKVLSLIQETTNVSINSNEVKSCRRLDRGAVILTLTPGNYDDKVSVIKQARQYWKDTKQQINSNIIGETDSEVSFNHQLTKEMSVLFKECRQLKQDEKVAFVWIDNQSCKLLVKIDKDDKKSVYHIANEADLKKLKAKFD